MTAKTKAPFNFGKFNVAKATDTPIEIELFLPFDARDDDGNILIKENDKLGVFISVVGRESRTFKAYARKQQDAETLARYQRELNNEPELPATSEENERKLADLIAHCVTGWRTVIDGKSEPVIYEGPDAIEFSTEACREWLLKYDWAAPQIFNATGDLSNFIRA